MGSGLWLWAQWKMFSCTKPHCTNIASAVRFRELELTDDKTRFLCIYVMNQVVHKFQSDYWDPACSAESLMVLHCTTSVQTAAVRLQVAPLTASISVVAPWVLPVPTVTSPPAGMEYFLLHQKLLHSPVAERGVRQREMQVLWVHRGIRYTKSACVFNDLPPWRVTLPEKEIAALDCFHLLNIALNSDSLTLKEA